MKRLLFIISMLTATLMPAYATDIDGICSTLSDAVIAGDLSNAEDLASRIYGRKSECSAENLADLTLAYRDLAEKSSDAVSRYDFVLKTIDCYKAAVAKDAAAATARFKTKGVDMAAVVKDYSANLDKYQKAIADSMNF